MSGDSLVLQQEVQDKFNKLDYNLQQAFTNFTQTVLKNKNATDKYPTANDIMVFLIKLSDEYRQLRNEEYYIIAGAQVLLERFFKKAAMDTSGKISAYSNVNAHNWGILCATSILIVASMHKGDKEGRSELLPFLALATDRSTEQIIGFESKFYYGVDFTVEKRQSLGFDLFDQLNPDLQEELNENFMKYSKDIPEFELNEFMAKASKDFESDYPQYKGKMKDAAKSPEFTSFLRQRLNVYVDEAKQRLAVLKDESKNALPPLQTEQQHVLYLMRKAKGRLNAININDTTKAAPSTPDKTNSPSKNT